MFEIQILADNYVAVPRPMELRAEWGFSASINDVLFDAGQTGIAYDNADLLGLDTEFDTIVLSHGHYDHSGGLPRFLNGDTKLYLHPEAWKARNYKGTHIGMPYAKERIESSAEIIEHREPIEVAENIYATGEIPRKNKDNPVGKISENGKQIADHIPDDQALAMKMGEGIALILGCCHAGLRNTVEHAEEILEDEVRIIIGGTHLMAMKKEEVYEVAEWLSEKIDLIAPTHCTGFEAEAILRSELQDKFKTVGVGSKIEI